MREQFGATNAVLNEAMTVSRCEGCAQEEQEKRKFTVNATRYRDLFVKSGRSRDSTCPTC